MSIVFILSAQRGIVAKLNLFCFSLKSEGAKKKKKVICDGCEAKPVQLLEKNVEMIQSVNSNCQFLAELTKTTSINGTEIFHKCHYIEI